MSPTNRFINHLLHILLTQVVLDKPFQDQGIVGDCNIKVLLRLQGGGGGKKALEKENKARMLPKQMKLNY